MKQPNYGKTTLKVIMKKEKYRIAIIGAGGQAKETLSVVQILGSTVADMEFVGFFETISTKEEFMGYPVKNISEFDPNISYHIAIGDPQVRKKIFESMPFDTKWFSVIHPSTIVGQDVQFGEGVFVGQGTIITENVKIGNHSHINIGSSISHDVVLGNYFTTAPGARVLGNCFIGECVFLGASSTIKEKLRICSNAIIGMGSAVVKNIEEEGTYIGVPAKKI
jgi:sugar O-acyltransferase (sialic acid O-acetyltransferase NeuD family)